MAGAQTQQMINRKLNTKLDKITKMLGTVLEKMDKAEPDRNLVKKIAKEWKDIDSGLTRVHHYKNMADFERAMG